MDERDQKELAELMLTTWRNLDQPKRNRRAALHTQWKAEINRLPPRARDKAQSQMDAFTAAAIVRMEEERLSPDEIRKRFG